MKKAVLVPTFTVGMYASKLSIAAELRAMAEVAMRVKGIETKDKLVEQSRADSVQSGKEADSTSDQAEHIRYSRTEAKARAVDLEVIGEATDE